MFMKKLVIFLVVALFSTFSTLAQDVENRQPFSTPTAPAAFEFLKYGDIPMNEYTGRATVTVPIYNLQVDDAQLPLQLNYTTGGIRVDQEASMVGLGWDFNIPSVVQIINDKDDYDTATTHQTLPDIVGGPNMPTLGATWPNLSETTYVGMPYGGSNTINEVPLYFKASRDFIVFEDKYTNQYEEMTFGFHMDSEPDIFKVTINGDELIMATDRSLLPPQDAAIPYPLIIINNKPQYKVELLTDVVNTVEKVSGIKITDPFATQHFFDIIDVITTSSTVSGHLAAPLGSGSQRVTSKIFKLSKMVTRSGNEILVSYNETNVLGSRKLGQQYFRKKAQTIESTSEIPDRKLFDGINNSQDGYATTTNHFHNDDRTNGTLETSHTASQNFNYATQITTPKEKIVFGYSDRLDYSGMKRLDRVLIYDHRDNLINQFDLNYTYTDSPNSSGVSAFLKKRLILTKVQESGKGAYEFEYNSTLLPPKNSFKVDYWGYYNGKNNSSLIPSLALCGYPEFNDNASNDFNAYLDYTKAQSLEKITYPTGGSSTLEYELNTFDSYFNSGPNVTSGHGIRVSKRLDRTNATNLAQTTQFSYSGGKAISKKNIVREFTERVFRVFSPSSRRTFRTPVVSIGIDGFNSSSGLVEGDYIGYDEVTVQNSDQNGRIVKEFVNNPNQVFGITVGKDFNPMYGTQKGAIKNGSLRTEKAFTNDNKMVSFSEYSYLTKTTTGTHYGVKFNPAETYVMSYLNNGSYHYYYIPYSILTFYPIYANCTYLQSKIERTYKDEIEIASRKTTYGYDVYNNITSERLEDPNIQEENGTRVTYNFDITSFGRDNNFLSVLRSSKTFRYDASNSATTSDQYFYYQKYPQHNNAILMYESWECAKSSYPNNFDDTCIKTSYTKYTNNGKVLQYDIRDGISTTILWGYDYQYPIAKIENASYAQVMTALGRTSGDNLSYLQNYSAAQIRIEMDKIRAHSTMKNAFVTTYTYSLLRGLESMTDPKGYTTYYTYDEGNRLKEVKDAEGNIVTENKYHYRSNN